MNSFPPNFAKDAYEQHKGIMQDKILNEKAEIRSNIHKSLVSQGVYYAPWRNVSDIHKQVIQELTDLKIEVEVDGDTNIHSDNTHGPKWIIIQNNDQETWKNVIGCKVSFLIN